MLFHDQKSGGKPCATNGSAIVRNGRGTIESLVKASFTTP